MIKMTMEEWILEMAVMCFALMGIVAWALNVISKFGEKFVNDLNNDDENGVNE